MYVCCLDMEGVITPEIWIEFAEATGIPELKRTTRDEPDYAKLMDWRIGILREHDLGLPQIQEVIAGMEPLEGAREFLDELRSQAQVIIVSDTFEQFAMPLMAKLGYPTLFCNSLVVGDDGMVEDVQMRCTASKVTTVRGLKGIGFDVIAAGDSHNDIGMIRESKAGFLFRTTEQIKADNPDLPALETHEELLEAFRRELAK